MEVYPIIKDKAWFSIKGNEYLKRAIEVSLTGQHTITVIGNVDNGKDYIETIYKSRDIEDRIFNENLLIFIEPCLCGNFGDPFRSCDCPTEKIIEHRLTDTYRQAMRSSILVKLDTPLFKDFTNGQEHFSIVVKSIEKSIKNFGDNVFKNITDFSAMELLETAYKRIGFTMCQVERIKHVARTIAIMDNSEVVQAHHMAEAIQYQAF